MELLEAIDQGFLPWFQARRTPLADDLMLGVTRFGDRWCLGLLLLVAVGLLAIRRCYRAAAVVLVTTVTGILLAQATKELVRRPRPEVVRPLVTDIRGWSFPSGHALYSAAFYPTLAAVLAGRLRRRGPRILLIGCSCLLVFLIGLSRVYLGVHYVSDVLAGWIAGGACALAGSRALASGAHTSSD